MDAVLEIDRSKRYFARTDAVSTGVRSIGYDPRARTLDIEFPSRESYRYFGVGIDEFIGLMNTDSIGAYVNQHIKPDHPNPEKLAAAGHARRNTAS